MRLAAARGGAREDRADASDRADDNRADRPAGAIEVEAEGVVQRPCASPDACQREHGGGDQQVELIALVGVPDPVRRMDRDDGSRHDGDQDSRGEWREQAEGDQRPAGEFGRARRPGVQPAGAQADAVEHAGRAVQSAAAERAEELLGAVADEEQADDKAEYEQCEIHGDPPEGRSLAECLPAQVILKRRARVAGWLLLRRTGIGWTDASADQPRRAVPCARELEPDGPCRRADHPRPFDDAERRAHLQGHLRPDGGAHAAPATAALAAGRGPLRPRLSVLARRSRLRPRLPRPGAGAATRGREGEALGTGGADRSASARSLPAALGAVSDSRARGWAQGPAHEDPSLADRRTVRCGDYGRALRPRSRGTGAARAERERGRPQADGPGDAHAWLDGPAALPAANASVSAPSAAQP